jgi:hypothetical protein
VEVIREEKEDEEEDERARESAMNLWLLLHHI